MEIIDSHCHVHFNDYDADRAEVLKASAKAAVTRLICVGCNLADSERAIKLAANHEGIWATAGSHPHDGADFARDPSAPNRLRELLKKPKVVAVGEIGLDYYRDRSPRSEQEKALRTQIEIGLEAGLPFVFHVREAWKGFWPIIDSYQGIKGVIHSFSAAPGQLEETLRRGLLVGLNGLLTYTKEDSWKDSARRVPLDKLLLETDAPFLTPLPFRGQRCEPKHTAVTAEFLAKLRNESLEELAKASTANAIELFNLDSRQELTK